MPFDAPLPPPAITPVAAAMPVPLRVFSALTQIMHFTQSSSSTRNVHNSGGMLVEEPGLLADAADAPQAALTILKS